MYKNYKIIVVVPAGRKRYLEILHIYLKRNKNIIDECHFWENTVNENEKDLRFIRKICKNSKYFKNIKCPLRGMNHIEKIHWFFHYTVDPNTIYIRLDDDIVFIENNAIKNLLDFRIKNPNFFLVSPLVINNNICAKIMQDKKSIHLSQNLDFNFRGKLWKQPKLAEEIHNAFFSDFKNKNLKKYYFEKFELPCGKNFSINCICWFGKEFKKFNGIVPRHPSEEDFLSNQKPLELQKPICIHGKSIMCHFSYYSQLNGLRNTGLLNEYKRIASKIY